MAQDSEGVGFKNLTGQIPKGQGNQVNAHRGFIDTGRSAVTVGAKGSASKSPNAGAAQVGGAGVGGRAGLPRPGKVSGGSTPGASARRSSSPNTGQNTRYGSTTRPKGAQAGKAGARGGASKSPNAGAATIRKSKGR